MNGEGTAAQPDPSVCGAPASAGLRAKQVVLWVQVVGSAQGELCRHQGVQVPVDSNTMDIPASTHITEDLGGGGAYFNIVKIPMATLCSTVGIGFWESLNTDAQEVILQQDGNLVIYARVSKTRGAPGLNLGNLDLRHPTCHPNNAQSGHLTFTDEGALVLYIPGNVVWCSRDDT
ncbi:unnamed protein product, partial [Coregonus sp. 'balchen']